jgi:hypothetical protein
MLTALLLAVPAAYAADVTISCTADGNEVTVSYTASADANKPRAFGLDIELNNAETITSLTLLDPNYWVSPGTIDINESGVIENDGNGIGQQDDAAYPLTLYGLDSNGITIEIGSLHSPPEYGSPNAPDLSSAILKFTVSGDCNVAISGNAARGNVVLYDATAADVSYGTCSVTVAACATCRGDWNGNGTVDLNTDILPMIGKINQARFLTGNPWYTEADTITYPALGPWNPCADWNGDGTFQLNQDLLPAIGKINQARFLLGNPWYTCNHPSIDP